MSDREDIGAFGKKLVCRSYYNQPRTDDPRRRRPAIEEPGIIRRKHRWADAGDSIRTLRSRPNSSGEVPKGAQGERGCDEVGFSSGIGEKRPARNSAEVRYAGRRGALRYNTRSNSRRTQGRKSEHSEKPAAVPNSSRKRTEAPGGIRPCFPAEVAADESLPRQDQKGIDFRTLEAVRRKVGGKVL